MPGRFLSRCTPRYLVARGSCSDTAPVDWGGEGSDYFASHLTVNNRRYTAAFLLKGPAKFRPMTTAHLGKNQDQLLRLTAEEADIFVVQHCHEVTPPVRKLLRALTSQAGYSRRYCVIDGRDSLRLLQAFSWYDRALAMSNSGRP